MLDFLIAIVMVKENIQQEESIIFEIRMDLQYLVLFISLTIFLLLAMLIVILTIAWYFFCCTFHEENEHSESDDGRTALSMVIPKNDFTTSSPEENKKQEKLAKMSKKLSPTPAVETKTTTKVAGPSLNIPRSKSGSIYKPAAETGSILRRVKSFSGRNRARDQGSNVLTKWLGKNAVESEAVCAVRLGRMKDCQGDRAKWKQWRVKGILGREDEDEDFFEAQQGQASGKVPLSTKTKLRTAGELGPGIWTVFGGDNKLIC